MTWERVGKVRVDWGVTAPIKPMQSKAKEVLDESAGRSLYVLHVT